VNILTVMREACVKRDDFLDKAHASRCGIGQLIYLPILSMLRSQWGADMPLERAGEL
jgi:hypothetical protein